MEQSKISRRLKVSAKKPCFVSFALAILMAVLAGSLSLLAQGTQNADQQALDAFKKGDYDMAISCATLAIHLDSSDAMAYYYRGTAHQAQSDNDKAIADLDRAIALNPKNANAYYWRGEAYQAQGDNDHAIADFSMAIQGNSDFPIYCLINRGIAYADKRNYANAIADYNQALQLKPEYLNSYANLAYNNLAWLLATCPDPRFRDGHKAVEYATKVCDLTYWKDPSTLDTLSAAYAEAGDFRNAVKWQTYFLTFPNLPPKIIADGKIRLALYETHKPYHAEK
jgi:tetratricopeptide (TPR) repeat protein